MSAPVPGPAPRSPAPAIEPEAPRAAAAIEAADEALHAVEPEPGDEAASEPGDYALGSIEGLRDGTQGADDAIAAAESCASACGFEPDAFRAIVGELAQAGDFEDLDHLAGAAAIAATRHGIPLQAVSRFFQSFLPKIRAQHELGHLDADFAKTLMQAPRGSAAQRAATEKWRALHQRAYGGKRR